MGISIMANKIEGHNPISSKLFLVTNTTYSASILSKGWVMGIIQFFSSISLELFNVIKYFSIFLQLKKLLFRDKLNAKGIILFRLKTI